MMVALFGVRWLLMSVAGLEARVKLVGPRPIAANRARYVVCPPPEGGGGTCLGIFIRFSRCQFERVPVRSGFERMFAHGRAGAAIERPNSLELPPP